MHKTGACLPKQWQAGPLVQALVLDHPYFQLGETETITSLGTYKDEIGRAHV